MKFEEGKKYVFDKDTYFKDNREDDNILDMYWIDKCNQKDVKIIDEYAGYVKAGSSVYSIVPKWCIEKPIVRKMTVDNEEEF